MISSIHPGDSAGILDQNDVDEFTPEPLGAQAGIERELVGLVEQLTGVCRIQGEEIKQLKSRLRCVEKLVAGEIVGRKS